MENTEKLLSPKEIAERLSLKPDTVRRYIRKGIIKSVKIGNRLRVKESDFNKYLESLKK